MERALAGCRLAERYIVGPASQIDGAGALALELRAGTAAADAGVGGSLIEQLVNDARQPASLAHTIEALAGAIGHLPPQATGQPSLGALIGQCAVAAGGVVDAASAMRGLSTLESWLIRVGDLVPAAYLLRRDPITATSPGMAP